MKNDVIIDGIKRINFFVENNKSFFIILIINKTTPAIDLNKRK
jgi:hypothetical protein